MDSISLNAGSRQKDVAMLEQTLEEAASQEQRSESVMHRSELQFHRLLEKLPAGAYTCDPEGLVTYFNRHAVQLWGRTPKLNDPVDRFCGSFKLFSTDGTPIAHDRCWMALALQMDKEFNGQEIVIERPDGTRLTVLAHANPIRDESGKLLGAVNVLVDISDRKRTEEERQQKEEALRRLSAHLESVREEQSAKIAREVHDELGGTLTMLKLGLAALLEKTPENEPLRQRLESLLSLADTAVKTVKRISSALRPVLLDTLGLAATIRRHAEEFSRLTGIRTELHLPEYIRLSPERSTAVFRIVQEALSNVARHAKATEVAVRARKAKGELLVEIADNGRGIVAADLAKTNSFGILGMRERSQYLGGNLGIQGPPDQGTTLALRLPLEP